MVAHETCAAPLYTVRHVRRFAYEMRTRVCPCGSERNRPGTQAHGCTFKLVEKDALVRKIALPCQGGRTGCAQRTRTHTHSLSLSLSLTLTLTLTSLLSSFLSPSHKHTHTHTHTHMHTHIYTYILPNTDLIQIAHAGLCLEHHCLSLGGQKTTRCESGKAIPCIDASLRRHKHVRSHAPAAVLPGPRRGAAARSLPRALERLSYQQRRSERARESERVSE
jgi:hypothetical protein